MKPKTFIVENKRRSANYKPNIWSYDYIESLTSKYTEAAYQRQIEKLKTEFAHIFDQARGVNKLRLIESINNLCLSSLFEKEIKGTLDALQFDVDGLEGLKDDLEATALYFKLLRQHSYDVSQDIFINFIDNKGAFKESLRTNIRGVLQLYEASHLAIQEENIMNEAKDFSKESLRNLDLDMDVSISKQVIDALEHPLHWTAQWFRVRRQIDAYEHQVDRNPILLELAKLNFNVVQAIHQRELQELSRWWRNLGLMHEINFSRDRLIESFLCTTGVAFEPHYACLRKCLTKVICFTLIIDDLYDIYGSLEELDCFTRAMYRWNSKEIEHLPKSMKLCFSALQDTMNEVAQAIHKEQCWNGILSFVEKAWADVCKAFLLEARWFNEGFTPSLEEYLKSAWISSTCPLISLITHLIEEEGPYEELLDKLEQKKNLIYYSSLIFKLWNDLSTSDVELERGDAPSSIFCYMREANVSEDTARGHIRGLIINAWNNINKELIERFSKHQRSANLIISAARVSHFLYCNGDGIGVQDCQTKQLIQNLLIEPVAISYNDHINGI
ncbi:hypothetical protein Nepgr_032147 [Nepenthes gracilis]|uniref:Uncharacterized protein n=1 Tax=Nepenthes gracilis TaxID=150966 RepID=A0AAD3TJK4_NEPGR|nr:hypothetical protein Nepgr_032147 [Nepenthes gracilis]